ncbi:MAG: bifunctional phosphopantothenoylcysteine decarboxylase/phosphopantothenate--cysteine ligase CoaBC [Thermoprotei archaeon]|nr:MAG: bifunctional phosphopantothenoylcysteine decarboxylase/phosphopantothenate--cysteine ligase CoaBC [Thermoprotei archaeon]
MCTLLLLYKVIEDYPIIALHNRYTPKGTREYRPQVLKLRYKVYCPLDLQVKGSWIGFNEQGLLAAVTDQHTGDEVKPRRSRGVLLLDILGNYESAKEAKDYLVRELPRGGYRKCNFVVADKEHAYHLIYDQEVTIREIKPGPYVVTNITLLPTTKLTDEVKQTAERAKKRSDRALELARELLKICENQPSPLKTVVEGLENIARDHAYGESIESICLHDDYWTTSSSTIIIINKDIKESRILYCKGHPCRGVFIDYSYLIKGIEKGEVMLKSTKLMGRRIALCLTGSAAVTLAPLLARELRRHGAEVQCYMTKYAIEFGLNPKLMEWATKSRVIVELTGQVEHLADYDLVIIYPATLNTINKIAFGIADNAVTTLCAATPPNRLLIILAMNMRLFSNPVLQESINKLRELGVTILMPRFEEGVAKIPKVEEVVDHAIRLMTTSKLRDRKVLILTGPTRYRIDAVRCITNSATGRIGYWLAKEAYHRGCRVKVIYGPGVVTFPRYIPVVRVETTEDYLRETLRELDKYVYDYVIFSAAIMDYKPEKTLDYKVKSGLSEWPLKLIPTPKVIREVRAKHPEVEIVAFKLEYGVPEEELIRSARELLSEVEAALVVANDIAKVRGDYHEAILIDRRGRIIEFKGLKKELASRILDILEELL